MFIKAGDRGATLHCARDAPQASLGVPRSRIKAGERGAAHGKRPVGDSHPTTQLASMGLPGSRIKAGARGRQLAPIGVPGSRIKVGVRGRHLARDPSPMALTHDS